MQKINKTTELARNRNTSWNFLYRSIMKTKSLWLLQAAHLFITGQGYVKRNNNNKALLDGLKPVVFLGRLLCALSRNDVLSKKETQKKLLVPVPFMISGLLTTFYGINAILLTRANFRRFQTDNTISEKLGEFSLPGYACTMFFVYGYQLFGTKRFRNVVQSFLQANSRTQISIQFSSSYRRFCWCIMVCCMIFGITENVMYDVSNLKKAEVKRVEANSTMELYYVQTFHHWAEIIPYNPVLTIIYTILIKCGTWGWVYMDIIAIVLCRAIAEKFRMMNEEISLLMNPQHSSMSLKTKIPESRILTLTWDAVRDEFVMLTDLSLQIQKFIAPLILACYGANMYIIVISLFYWIAPYAKFSFEESSYNYFAFLQFLFRVASVTYFAAEVHHVSHSIVKTVQRCPNSMYSLSLERLERTLLGSPNGICLFGSFMITRKFFISIVSFIFTTEIVILQTANSFRGHI